MNTPLNTLGATNLSDRDREKNDYYGTSPEAVDDILDREVLDHKVWEPTAGHHNIVSELKKYSYDVRSSDLIDYGFNDELVDFLSTDKEWDGDLIFNPPYKLAGEFVEHGLKLLPAGHKMIAFLRLQFLEGQKRFENIFKTDPPVRVYVYVKRQVCSSKDDFTEGSAVAYVWMVWEKGFKGDPVIKWIV